MTASEIFVIIAGSSVLASILNQLLNNVFGWAKGKAETRATRIKASTDFDALAGKWVDRFQEANQELINEVKALKNVVVDLIGAVERATPHLEQVLGSESAVVVDMRRASLNARKIV